MVNKFIQEYYDIIKLIKSHKKYIRSDSTKQCLSEFYEKKWLPYSLDFKKQYGQQNYDIIENALLWAYKNSKKDFIEKNKIKTRLEQISSVLDGIKHSLIRNYGFIIETSQKENIIKTLRQLDFKDTIGFIEDSEKEFRNGHSKPACTNARHAMDEFFRNFRERLFNKNIVGVTATEHIGTINNKIKMPSSEAALFKNGVYLFLSHKGGHATTDKPTPEDAKLSINLIYICFEYFLEKYGKYLNKKPSQDPWAFSIDLKTLTR